MYTHLRKLHYELTILFIEFYRISTVHSCFHKIKLIIVIVGNNF